MKPFRNHGWDHYTKVHAIMPQGGARGDLAFSPFMAPPSMTAPAAIASGPDEAATGITISAFLATSFIDI